MRPTPEFESDGVAKAAILPGPVTGIGHAQLARLFRIILILQSKAFPNARKLSETFEVSRRTIHRDIEALIDVGVPVKFRQERQGYDLTKGFFLPPLALEAGEALSLLVLARQSARGNGLGLARLAWSAALKSVESLPTDTRERTLATAEAFEDESLESVSLPRREEVHGTILKSLASRRQLRLWYVERVSLEAECTKFAVYRVVLRGETWFLIGRSSLHRRIEVIGIPWVKQAVLTDEPYSVPERFTLKRFLGMAWGVDPSPIRYKVWLKFSARVAPEVSEDAHRRGLTPESQGDGSLELHFSVDGIEELARWVLGFGDQVEVVAPPELRDRILEVAQNLTRIHHRTPNCPHPPAVLN